MDWTNETVIHFLELYQSHPGLWKPKDPNYKNKNQRNNAWIDIKNNLGEPCTVNELMRKKQSLMSAYRNYRRKIKKSKMSGGSDVYKPAWFAYSMMDSFLRPVYNDYLSANVEENENQDDASASHSDTCNEPQVYEILDDINMAGEIDVSNTEQEIGSRAKRKRHNPDEIQQAKEHIDQAFKILKASSQQQSDNEDDCDIFGKLIAQRLRKLPEDRKELIMFKISKLFYKESHERSRRSSSPSMNMTINETLVPNQ